MLPIFLRADLLPNCRKFHQFLIPPLRYWNPDIHFRELKHDKLEKPKVTIELGKCLSAY